MKQWSTWTLCNKEKEKCNWKRTKPCINATEPHLACGEDEDWLDMRKDCLECLSNPKWVI